jgi:hypothetical protein
MNWFATITIGLLTAALGAFLAGCVAVAAVTWYRISGFEGLSGYFVGAIGLLGGVAGLIVGLVTARKVAASAAPAFFTGLGLSSGIVVGIAGVAALISWLLADIPPKIDGKELDLAVEIRLPIGETILPGSVAGDSYLTLGSVNPLTHVQRRSERGALLVSEAKLVNGRWIIPGSVDIFTTRGKRSMEVVLGGKSRAGFIVPLPRRPGLKQEQWSEWLPRGRPDGRPWPETEYSYRFRVRRRVPPMPSPDPAVVEAEKFAALKPDGPIEEWLRFLREDMPAERAQALMKVVEEHPADLARAIRSTDQTTAERALSAVTKLSRVSPDVGEAVRDVGRNIADGIRRFNDMKADEADDYSFASDLRSRFSYWHRAWWTVHQKIGLDGRPLLREILDLALVRAKDPCMDEIVFNARVHLEHLESAAQRTS